MTPTHPLPDLLGCPFRKGSDAFLAGEPISNSPRTPDTMLSKRWRDGWLWYDLLPRGVQALFERFDP